jgi:hypothetical protein
LLCGEVTVRGRADALGEVTYLAAAPANSLPCAGQDQPLLAKASRDMRGLALRTQEAYIRAVVKFRSFPKALAGLGHD